MAKLLAVILALLILHENAFSQNKNTDSLLHQLCIISDDSARVWTLAALCSDYRYSNTDSSIYYGEMALNLARQIKQQRAEANTLNRLSVTYLVTGDLPRSLELQYAALKISEANNFQLEKAACLRRIGSVYTELKNYPKAIGLYHTALKIDSVIENRAGLAIGYNNLSVVYQNMTNADSALYYNQKAFKYLNSYKDLTTELYRVRGDIEAMKGNTVSAITNFQQGIQIGLKNNDNRNNSFTYSNLAALYKKTDQRDSSIFYAIKGIETGKKSSFKKGILLSANLLAQLFDSVNPVKALYYTKLADGVKDSLFGAGNIQTIQELVAKDEARQKEIAAAETTYRNKLKLYGLLVGVFTLVIIAIILFRNNRQKQKSNKVLQTTLDNLKSAQAQLIQSEKLASLGQLTVGIAHEIQNPLNFVNNFSEVSNELIDELKNEKLKGKDVRNDQLEDELLDDLKQNLGKINHHGKRADAIVKGMLQHTQASTGQKELTDINKLADQYLRMSYQGLLAKDKSFNAVPIAIRIKTDFDPNAGNINIVAQDIGRVLMNLYNNAFYAATLTALLPPEGGVKDPDDKHIPAVWVSTKKVGDKVVISVRDNGPGIPKDIIDKIFQPFFTTKPTGQGIGLGLSLSYDIVKTSGGSITVNSVAGEYAEFIVELPA